MSGHHEEMSWGLRNGNEWVKGNLGIGMREGTKAGQNSTKVKMRNLASILRCGLAQIPSWKHYKVIYRETQSWLTEMWTLQNGPATKSDQRNHLARPNRRKGNMEQLQKWRNALGLLQASRKYYAIRNSLWITRALPLYTQ